MSEVSLAELEKGLKESKGAIATEQIIVGLINRKDLELKTRIPNVLAMSILDLIGEYVEVEFGKKNSEIFKSLLKAYRINAVSSKGLSREEVIRALGAQSGMRPEEGEIKKLTQRLLGR